MSPTSSFTYLPPPGAGSLAHAVAWLRDLLLGSLGVSVAVMAVAAIGFLALSGRVDARRAVTAVLGCFVLFGAPLLGGSLFALVTGARMEQPEPAPAPAPAPAAPAPEPPRAPPPPPANTDPYAGAAVPPR